MKTDDDVLKFLQGLIVDVIPAEIHLTGRAPHSDHLRPATYEEECLLAQVDSKIFDYMKSTFWFIVFTANIIIYRNIG